MGEFHGGHFLGLAEILQIEFAAAAAGNIDCRLEGLNFCLVDGQFQFSSVSRFITEAAFGRDI